MTQGSAQRGDVQHHEAPLGDGHVGGVGLASTRPGDLDHDAVSASGQP